MVPLRVQIIVLFLLTAVAAGCLEPPAEVQGPAGEAPRIEAMGRFQPYVPPAAENASGEVRFSALRTGFSGAEPSIGVTSNGYVFITAMADLVRTTDGGASWHRASTQVSAPTTFDPYLWVDQATDRIYHVNLYVANSYVSISDDHGDTWITHPAAGGPGDHQKLATGPPAPGNPLAGTLHPSVVYYAVNLLTHTQISVSLDGGITWPSQPAALPLACDSGGINGQPHGAPSGTAYVPYYGCGGLVVARSTDNGLTWTPHVVSTEFGRGIFDPDLSSDRAGNTYAAWMGGGEAGYTTVYSATTDDGLTWKTPLRVAPEPLGTTIFPTIIAGDEGNVWIAYYATSNTTDHPDEAGAEVEWYLYATHIKDAQTEDPIMTSHLLDPHPVQLGRICTAGVACDSNRNLLEFIDTAIDPQTGRLWIVYTDGCDEDCTAEADSQSRGSAVARLDEGPSLLREMGWLAPIE